jgi:predicted TIM-barrel fold metal-dependent hydrolase
MKGHKDAREATTMTETTSDRYTIISADTHAGGSHAQYREYLDPAFVEDFDAWRGKYKNPFKDLKDDRRSRNWDSAQRWSDQEQDGVVAEVIFPNTVPPFFPSFVLFAQPPKDDEYVHRHAGIQAHNRWLADYVAEAPERRAGIGQIFTNDVDDAIADALWTKEHDLRGGVLLPNGGPDVKWGRPVYDPELDRLWAVLQDNEIPVHVHGGTGLPDYGRYPVSPLLYISEVRFYSQRPLVHLILAGVFERFPRLKFVLTELGCSWVPPVLKELDVTINMLRSGKTGELRFSDDLMLPKLPSEYFAQNVWVGVSQPKILDAATLPFIGADRFMWGNDYPHEEGTHPFTREHLRQVFHGTSVHDMRKVLGESAAALYGFDMDALAPYAAKYGPTVAEISEPLIELPANANQALLQAASKGIPE